jgi:hypothetical protein
MRIEEASRILLICREQLSPAYHSLRIGEVRIREEVTQKASWQIIEKSSVPESAAFSEDRSLDACHNQFPGHLGASQKGSR